jgi:hypothetical protein
MFKQVDAFSLKKGPTESGEEVALEVGGEILPFKMLNLLPKYWILFALLLIPLTVIIYKKRSVVMNILNRIIF